MKGRFDMSTTREAPALAARTHHTAGKPPPARKRARWIPRVLLGLVAGILTLALMGLAYQGAATVRDRRAYPHPGQLIDVGGYSLHINCMGQGSPTVILEAGNLGMSADWVRIQQHVARTTRVCSYDRAGMGWSDPAPGTRDAAHISTELHTLLSIAGIAGPYVLVGHSYGGLYALGYAGRYADQVAGVVLVDASHPEQFTRSAEGRALFRRTARLGTVLPLLTRLGVVRLAHVLPAHPDLPPQQRAEIAAFNATTRQVVTSVQEFNATADTVSQVRFTGGLGSKPLVVVSAGAQPLGWLQLQNELAALSSDSIHHVIDGASHASLIFTERDAVASSGAVLQVVKAVRADQPLNRR